MSAAERDWLVDLLAEHFPIRDTGTEEVVCWCGWKPMFRLYGFAEWDAVRDHVVIVLRAEFRERVSSPEALFELGVSA